MKVRILAYGVQQTMDKAVQQSQSAAKAFVRGAVYEAEKIMTASQRMVPVDTSKLLNSKFINHNIDSNGVVSTLGYRATYALPVHNIGPDRVFHEVGSWQYLSRPLEDAIPGMQNRIAAYVKSEMGGA